MRWVASTVMSIKHFLIDGLKLLSFVRTSHNEGGIHDPYMYLDYFHDYFFNMLWCCLYFHRELNPASVLLKNNNRMQQTILRFYEVVLLLRDKGSCLEMAFPYASLDTSPQGKSLYSAFSQVLYFFWGAIYEWDRESSEDRSQVY